MTVDRTYEEIGSCWLTRGAGGRPRWPLSRTQGWTLGTPERPTVLTFLGFVQRPSLGHSDAHETAVAA